MGEQAITHDQADLFVHKLNRFCATLDEQEQGWLVTLLSATAPDQEVQGFLMPPCPFSLSFEPLAPGPQSTALGAGKTTFHPFSITRNIDKSSPSLYL